MCWPFGWMWRRWVLPLQNFEFEIDAVRSELDQLEKKEFLNDEKLGILKKCRNLLAITESAFYRCFPRELFIWQMLFRIRQNILLIAPHEELFAKCFVLKKRLRRLKKDEARNRRNTECKKWKKSGWKKWKKLLKAAENGLNDPEKRKQDDMKWRSNLKEVCAFLDNQIILQLWKSIKLRRQSRIFVIIVIPLSGLLVAHVCFGLWLVDCAEWVADCAKFAATGRLHSPIFMVIAGTLGAFVSMLSSSSNDSNRGAPLAYVSFVRPILGGISGLFLYLTTGVGIIKVDFPALYAAAIAFGFSERAFSAALNRLSGETEKGIEAGRAR